tara:strand:- start:1119 stop:2012 length:894 start_codon:yes stop_codon:yes gene_type:complete
MKIATRSSKLALAQTSFFESWVSKEPAEIIEIKTEGDKKSAMGEVLFDKANFVNDIEKILLNDGADVAIHSAKDMAASKHPELDHFFFGPKSRSDLLIFKKGVNPVFEKDMKLGTSSLRRKLQAKFYLGAENIVPLSGNVDTRINKLNKGLYDCIILAKAGCQRLELNFEDLNYLELNHLSCAGQGVLAVQYKPGNEFAKEFILEWKQNFLQRVIHDETEMEKKFLEQINADCNSAIAVRADHVGPKGVDKIIKGEIYGLNEYISFEGKSNHIDTAITDAIKILESKNGLELLNEHN